VFEKEARLAITRYDRLISSIAPLTLSPALFPL
jgi:hypothetical protein